MVRHESAEALGAIEGTDEDWGRCEAVLRTFCADADPVVAESCQVALDAADYWQRAEEFGSDGVQGFAELKRQSEKRGVVEGGTAACQLSPLLGHFNITVPRTSTAIAAANEVEGGQAAAS